MSASVGEQYASLEQIPVGEIEAIARIIAVERELLQRRVDHEQLPAPGRPVPRGQHPKHHGCVRAEFVVAEDLPKPLRVGLFCQPGQRFPAWIRFSNARVEDDRHPGGHGMAIKLMGVAGTTLLEGSEQAGTHDFLLLDSPIFFIKNALEYAQFEAARLAMERSWLGLLSLAGYFATHLDEALILRRIEQNMVLNPLEATYWSATPYLLGDRAVKYQARARFDAPGITAGTSSVDQLRLAMTQNLATRDAQFDFSVQWQGDAAHYPIEDPTHPWDERESPWQRVATIVIPRQVFDTAAQMTFCQNLAFNPWRALAEHRPLGGINRIRRAVYVALAGLRHQLNQVAAQEPTPTTSPAD